jgi:CRISPR-associated protein (TIGR02710 family)
MCLLSFGGIMERILVLTVGLGDISRLDQTLYAPLRRSVTEGRWERIVLLPSQVTRDRAGELERELADLPVEIRPLPRAGMESDADECFDHFNAVLATLIAAGADPSDITVDFTRGTKAMSAAAVLAAVGNEVTSLRYIDGDRDERGTVVPGTERIRDASTAFATGRRDLDRARHFLHHLQFAAVEQLLAVGRQTPVRKYAGEIERAVWLARVWGAWDRFDYSAAYTVLTEEPKEAVPQDWRRLVPRPDNVAFIGRLAAPASREAPAMAQFTRDLVADLLANARRRLWLGQREDTLLRAYRALELMGQARLYDHGLKSENVDQSHAGVAKFMTEMISKKEPLTADNRGRINLARQNVARLLKSMGDSFGTKLIQAAEAEGVKQRNQSLLIHGFEALAGAAPVSDLSSMLDSLERLFREDDPSNSARMAAAGFPFGGG